MSESTRQIRIGLPKGRMQEGVVALLRDAGVRLSTSSRGYRPSISLPGFETKLLKPQNIVEMLAAGSRDVGFAGADWVAELGVDLVELLDTGLDPVRIVAAAPASLLEAGSLPKRQIVIASELENLTRTWVSERGLDATFVRSYGATEVFPPEDADCIVDITQTGSTLDANRLEIVDELMTSSTRLWASPRAMRDDAKRDAIERLVVLIRSVLEARNRVMLEVNVSPELLDKVVAVLPCMREPTISPLHGGGGYAVQAAVPRDRLATLVPELKASGGTDVVVTTPTQIVP